MRPLFAALSLSLVVVQACRSSVEATDCARFDRALVRDAVPADSLDWRAMLMAQAKNMPPDTILGVSIFFKDRPTAADSAVILEHGGRVIYSFRGLPAYGVKMSAEDLASLAEQSSLYPRITLMQIGLQGQRTEACR